MKNHRTVWRVGLGAALGLGWPATAPSQVVITAADLFNQAGQYYRAYSSAATTTSVNVSGLLGGVGGPQLWDFTTGPSEVTYRYDYLAATNTLQGADFVAAGARVAEQKTDEAGAVPQALLYFTQDPTLGRRTYGFYDPGFSVGIGSAQPQQMFSPPIYDFPATIHYGDSWSCATTYTNTISFGDPTDPEGGFFAMDMIYDYSATAVVDAYGLVNSPGIDFGDCLRVNELVKYDTGWDDGGSVTPLGTDYVRNYYWLRPGRGIVAQVTSKQSSGTPPDNNFPTAAAVLRMFETNHRDGADPGTASGIQGFKMTLGKTSALLQWTFSPAATHYRVDYTTNPTGGWQALGSLTTNNYALDTAAGKPATPVRFYRVVGLP